MDAGSIDRTGLEAVEESNMRASKSAASAAPSSDSLMAQLTAHNEKTPFNHWLGVEVLSASEEGVDLRVPWRQEFGGAPGMTHGGIMASLVDTAAFLALLAAQDAGGPTIDMRVDLHRSTAGEPLFVRSRLLRRGATVSTADVRIFDAHDRLVASGRCVFLTQPRVRPQDTAPVE
jgi:uncharacterized protein (TIGR00369 family)